MPGNDGLWQVSKEYNVDNQVIEVTRSLYDIATTAVLLNGIVGDFFRTVVGVRQRCPLSPVLFNSSLEKIMPKSMTTQHPSENGCFAGDAVIDAGETDIPRLSVSIR